MKNNIILGHFLGVDHIGHAFFADSPEMKNKMK